MDIQRIKNNYGVIGRDQALDHALDIALSIAPTDLTALIIGESGVGKDVIPRIIHDHSLRKTAKYFAVNCGAIPEGTVDSELFGHEKGSFTGAYEQRKGYFEEADGGTIFLDEVGELPLASQAKLLRVLQNGEFMRLGSSKVLKTNVRIIVATNVNLEHAVSVGKFREDLYYRLNAVTINMPSLRERREDIPLLFRQFVNDFTDRYKTRRITLDTGATIVLKNYRYPGNIRQLKNIAETMCAIEGPRLQDGVITMETARKYIPKEADTLLPAAPEKSEGMSATDKELILRSIFQLRQDVDYLKSLVGGNMPVPAEPKALPSGYEADLAGNDIEDQSEWQPAEDADLSVSRSMEDLIQKALEKHGGNRKAAAQELGISERTLYRKLKSNEAK